MRCSGARVLNTIHATRTGSPWWIFSVRSLASLIGDSLQRRANQISRLAAIACPRRNFQSDFQVLMATNLLRGASHALLASLGSCAQRVGYCCISWFLDSSSLLLCELPFQKDSPCIYRESTLPYLLQSSMTVGDNVKMMSILNRKR